jgi:hypothetical protein
MMVDTVTLAAMGLPLMVAMIACTRRWLVVATAVFVAIVAFSFVINGEYASCLFSSCLWPGLATALLGVLALFLAGWLGTGRGDARLGLLTLAAVAGIVLAQNPIFQVAAVALLVYLLFTSLRHRERV